MKKTLLAVALLSSLSLSGAANAFTESTDGNFTGSLDFSGTIVDDNPIWAWEIPAAPADVTGWDKLVINGVSQSGSTEFNFSSKSAMTLIHGYMKTKSVSGGAGITPVIKVGPTATAVTLSGDSLQDISVVATGKNAANEAVANGLMKLKARAFLGGAVIEHQSSGPDVVKFFGSAKAQVVLSGNQADFNTSYPGIISGVGTFTESEAMFVNQSVSDLSGAYVAEISDYKLSFPSATLPTTWSAIIPVTVTLK